MKDSKTLRRIRSLAVPPAWTDVWICPRANGHVQATGRDAKGRKQSVYHPSWRNVRDEAKFLRLREFGLALPDIRAAVERDLSSHGLPKRKVVALVVKLLEVTQIRVGNKRYAESNGSHGLTTLSSDELEAGSVVLRFRFRGKSGRFHEIEHRDRRLARLVRKCQSLPGQALFQFIGDDGEPAEVTSTDVNAYLQEVTAAPFTAKDFRTWAGTLEALRLIREATVSGRVVVTSVVKAVADLLGNTAAVCRKAYIHPCLLETFQDPPGWACTRLPRATVRYPDPLERLAVEVVLSPRPTATRIDAIPAASSV
ncbi:MAG: DNA topoisomerase IB [Armatimonadetes bacterium]|nr:DNA topoisomerase IB [Armatimonadota bacterium]